MSKEASGCSVQGAQVRLVAQHRNARQPVREVREIITILGSGDGCDLILASSKVDAAHAAIVKLNDTAYLCDLGAAGGTTLNRRRIRWARLADGDLPAIGPFSFKVDMDEGPNPIHSAHPAFSMRDDRTIGIVKCVDPVLIIGSDAGCDVVIKDATVAPRQAMIVWSQNGPIVRDLLRRKSVRHNGEKINESPLEHGDCVGVGRFEMVFEILDQPAEAGIENADERMEAALSAYEEDAVAPTQRATPTASAEQYGAMRSVPQPLSVPLVTVGQVPSVTPPTYGATDHEFAPDRVWTPPAMSETVTLSMAERDVDTKARFAAAQSALDERARKMWDGIQAERERLRAYQEELQRKSRELLDTANQKYEELRTREQQLAEEASRRDEAVRVAQVQTAVSVNMEAPEKDTTLTAMSTTPPAEDGATIERLFGGLFEPEAATLRNAEETARLAATLVKEGIKTPEADTNLARQAGELAELVRYEREQMEAAEGRLETLRFEIERLQATVARSQDRIKVQETQVEARTQAIRTAQGVIRKDRDEIAARIRQLDAKDAALKARMEEADRGRRELERETKQLARLQEEHEERRRELRLSLESERHRLRVRQAELQKKAAELVKAAKAKRRIIEDEVAFKQAEIEEREIELKARRTALTDSGRAQLERTAAELEQVLTVRLNDIESEVSHRQTELDQRMAELVSASGGHGALSPESATLEMSLEEISALARLEANDDSGELTRLEALQGEVEALRHAVGRFDEHEESLRSATHEAQLAALAGRRNQLQREQRWASILRSKLHEKAASLRGETVVAGTVAEAGVAAESSGTE
ncbi:MAG: FHA domain-containing protein [Planctomycetota bacterium]